MQTNWEMRTTIKNLFSLSITDTEYFENRKEKFELVSCPIKKMFCKETIASINEDYLMSQKYHLNKEYEKSLESLKSAYYKTMILAEPACAGCGDFFRSTIKQSMEAIKNEKYTMSLRLFNFKRYQIAPLNIESVLKVKEI